MSPKYKIIYFDARGIAETIRFLLSYMDEEFEEERVEFTKWLEYKPSKQNKLSTNKIYCVFINDRISVGKNSVLFVI